MHRTLKTCPKCSKKRRADTILDAILYGSVLVKGFEKELAGAIFTRLIDLSGYAWIATSLRHRSDEIATAIRAYLAKGRTFLEKASIQR